ncbi:ABC transporter ATP-binding protein [Verminephrobacter eiseniae]|uniref:ABC transporter ATP-binding protein n=1 Tax=Verminephrobacter eiseniae TaxID=364317 RepID=UPI0010D1E101|nr:ABC transporter ATP-binding protein [Verminephrobacter eiseniae]KAB7579027.1 ABC transporter ATP-binding protein [Verminephrobacter sp. Larva24]MCW5231610.1 ABC transporter ATP-binding protein [Verminephrobacter eiseniae]MCW5293340.1 ABC transporter ATP-binding protein [Verminephrobacter eiseniae]MCW8186787.1 ABC transporter ATP-binding protein [Verminephrobacter eiseniae]MCW8225149.1 ABC transporter ATP-binding protein [Verminephrobacter eiseniae]
MAVESSIALRASNLHKLYAFGETSVAALRGVDITIEQGDFAALCGPSGSGKSTLLNLLGLLEPPNQGEIWLDGQTVDHGATEALDQLRRNRLGFVFQSFNLVPVLSAIENVELPLLMTSISSSERRKRAESLLDAVGLADRMSHRPKQLSGGQQQRVAVARALVNAPLLVLADEPTASLDSQTAAQLLDLMQSLNRQLGTAFLFSTHDARVVERAQKLFTLSDGRILA